MATATKNTKEQVQELMDNGVEDAQEIAKRLGKTKATIYVHIRNIKMERGEKPRGRGRPPKVESSDGQAKATTRKAPPRVSSKQTTKASTRKTPKAPTTQRDNGHVPVGEEFPAIKAAIEAELGDARRKVAKLEGMLSTIES